MQIFHGIVYNLDPPSIASLSLANKSVYTQIFGSGCHLWKELTLRRYDPVHITEGFNWQKLYQSRSWVEKLLKDYALTASDVSKQVKMNGRSEWKVTGQYILLVIRDMIMENGVQAVGCTN